MYHDIWLVIGFEIVAPYTLRIEFDDGSTQTIDFWPLLRGELYSPLRNLDLFNQARLDRETGTLIWPNDADFDPATLHDWSEVRDAMIQMAQSWPLAQSQIKSEYEVVSA